MQYLKDKEYYSVLYDQETIRLCKDMEKKVAAGAPSFPAATKESKRSTKKAARLEKFGKDVLAAIAVHAIKVDRFEKKEDTIWKWMQQGKERDGQLKRATPPRGIRCSGCSTELVEDLRDLMPKSDGREEVLFLFVCPKCGARRAFWGGGTEWQSRHGSSVSEADTNDTEVAEPESDEAFETDRKKHCLSDAEGDASVLSWHGMRELAKEAMQRNEEERVRKEITEAKQLSIAELQNILTPLIADAGYVNFELGRPEVQRDVIVPFTAQDGKAGRAEQESREGLQNIIGKALEHTNWRLMSDGISYRLGILAGRLRGVEGEENLRRLVTGTGF